MKNQYHIFNIVRQAVVLWLITAMSLCAQAPVPAPVKIAADPYREMFRLSQLPAQRTWTGANGGTFEGEYVRQMALGQIVILRDSKTAKELTLPIEKFSPADKAWLRARLALEHKEIPAFLPAEWVDLISEQEVGLKPEIANVNRVWKEHDLKKLAVNFDVSTQETLVRTLLWWDEIGWLPVPKGRDFADKVDWLRKKIRCGSGGGRQVMVSALTEYLDKELPDHAKLQVFPAANHVATFQKKNQVTIKNIAKHATGANASFLVLDSYKGMNNNGYKVFYVSGVNGNRVSVNVHGKNFELELKTNEDERDKSAPEFHIVSPEQAPEWLRENRFVVNGEWFFSLRCRVYAVPGKKVEIPEAPPEPELFVRHSVHNTQIVHSGKKREGIITAANDASIWFMDNQGTVEKLDTKSLDQHSLNDILQWRASRGQSIKMGNDWYFLIGYGTEQPRQCILLSRKGKFLTIHRPVKDWQNPNQLTESPVHIFVNLETGAFVSLKASREPKLHGYGKIDLAKLRNRATERAHLVKQCQTWFLSTLPDTKKEGIMRKRESIRDIQANGLNQAIDLAFFPPEHEGSNSWPSMPATLAPFANDAIACLEAGFLAREYDYTKNSKVFPSMFEVRLEGCKAPEIKMPKFDEAEKMAPGTWVFLP